MEKVKFFFFTDQISAFDPTIILPLSWPKKKHTRRNLALKYLMVKIKEAMCYEKNYRHSYLTGLTGKLSFALYFLQKLCEKNTFDSHWI